MRLEKAAQAASNALAVLWLGLFPLLGVLWMKQPFQIPLSYANITRSKLELAVLLTIISIPLAAFCAFVRREQLKKIRLAKALLIAFFVLVALSARFGSYAAYRNEGGEAVVWVGAGRYEGLATQLCYFLIMICLSLCRPKTEWIAGAASVAVLVMTGVIALQYGGCNPLGFFLEGLSVYTNYEFQGTLGNIDMISGYLSLTVPLLFGYSLFKNGKPAALFLTAAACGTMVMLLIHVQSGLMALIAGAALLAAAMLLNPKLRSRGMTVLALLVLCFAVSRMVGLPWLDGAQAPWSVTTFWPNGALILSGNEKVVFPWNVTPTKLALLFAGAGMLFLARVLKKHPGKAVPLWAVLAAGCSVVALGIAVVLFLNIPQSMEGIWELHEILCGRAQDSFGSERYGIWRCTLQIAKDNLLIGTGPDTFLQAMRVYLARNGISFRQSFDNPHNLFLAVLMQNGLPALIYLLAGLAGTFIAGIRRKETAPMAAGMVCYLVQGFFTFSMCIVTPMFWVLTGLTLSLSGCDNQNNGKKKSNKKAAAPFLSE